MSDLLTHNPHESYLREVKDEDTTTQFDFDEQGFPPRFGYILTFQIEDHGGSSNGAQLQLTLRENGSRDTTTNYYQVEWNGTGWQTNTRDRWNIINTNTGQAAWGQILIGGGQYVAEPSNPYPTIHAVVGGSDPAFNLLFGELQNAHSTINGIRLSSAGANATGFATLDAWGPVTDR